MTEAPTLKEFLYVDIDRVRSLLAQLAGGIIEQVRASSANTMTGGAQALILGIGGRGERASSSQYEESRSLQDLTFDAFERLADENAYVTDLPPESRDAAKWQVGEIQSALLPGQIIRVNCEVQLLDAEFFESRVQRLLHLSKSIYSMQEGAASQYASRSSSSTKRTADNKAAIRERDAGLAAMMGGISHHQLEAIVRAVRAFVGDSVSIRILPCGLGHLEFAFIGNLLGRREYIQEERENLFSRYGQAPTKWTTVFQVAAVPAEPDAGSESYTAEDTTVDGSDQVLRSKMEKNAAGLLSYMEFLGIVEGPRWPSVSVTPLGIYRTVPRTSSLT
ncbi:MAG: hypothetical protein J0I11_18355 [Actinobacteria bacterium]|nr:hypothetical protein [Actinomycetota bacterium]